VEKHRFNYFASCPTGLEPLLETELCNCGARPGAAQRGGIPFETEDSMVALRVLLRSRVASRVFKLLYSFEAHNENSMYQDLADLKWKSIIDDHQTFRLTTIYGRLPDNRGGFTNSQFTTLKAKDAIVDWFNHHTGSRPSVDKERADVPLLLRIDDAGEGLFKVQLLLDLTGDPLSQRGYRISTTEAPLKENLAAGVLMLANWDPATEGLVDGMCGSGTFLAEAALIAGDISPQWLRLRAWKKGARPWAFLASQWFTKDKHLPGAFTHLAQDVMRADEAGLARLREQRPVIVGHDLSTTALRAARENMQIAGLEDLIPLSPLNAEVAEPKGAKCLFLANPPYGERLMAEQEDDLKALYYGIGENWKKNWKGHRAVILTGNLPLLKAISLRTSRRLTLWNGDIECRLVEYALY
jgi:23S rRNA G2445 N2-methylase RlmL